jgi:hypothetical protein
VSVLAVISSCATGDSGDTPPQSDGDREPTSEQSIERSTPTEADVDDEDALVPMDPTASYGGHIRVPVDARVIRDEEAYRAFVEHIPDKKVVKRQPAPDNDHPLLTLPEIDFDEHMLVAAVCPTFYCDIEFEGIRDEDSRHVVVVRLPGEGEHAEYQARASGIGNYRAVVVSRVDGPVTFEYVGPGEAPESNER